MIKHTFNDQRDAREYPDAHEGHAGIQPSLSQQWVNRDTEKIWLNYKGKSASQMSDEPASDGTDAEMLMKLLRNPEMAALIKTLAKNLK